MNTPQATSWSFSRLADFTRCKLAFKIKHIDRVPEPERPLPKGKTEHGNDRGTRVHDNIEGFIRGEHDDLCPEAEKHYGAFIDLLRAMYADKMVELEGEWAFDKEWNQADWKAGWLRLKLDVLIHLSATQAYVIDWKTGRHFGNEVTHGNQLNLYAMCTFLRYPQLEEIWVADYYIDHGRETERHFTRAQALKYMRTFDKQGNAITDCVSFPPNANRWSCQYCPWMDTGHCTVGVKK